VPQRERVTIVDVAALAGVHPGTVSRALGRPEQVASETRARVQAAVRQLGFVPNRAARGLITGRTGNVGVIVPDITNPHFAALVRSIERAGREEDVHVLLVDTGEQREEEVAAARALSQDVDGFVVLSPRRLHRQLDALGSTPAVFVNRPVRGRASVLLRTAPAVGQALHHLGSLGHTRIAYLGGPHGSWAAGERREAVRRTSRALGIEVVEVAVAAPTFEAAVQEVTRLVACGASAAIAFNDQMALGVLSAFTQLGMNVPGDVSIVGCDDVPMAAMVAPPLTTIKMPTDEAGAMAVRMLAQGALTGELFGTLAIRASTGPVTTRGSSASGAGRRQPSVAARG
jgi:LacI family transcriptional regulator